MEKKVLTLAVLFFTTSIGLICTEHVDAANREGEPMSGIILEDDWTDATTVVELPQGGYLHGEAIAYSDQNSKDIIASYNSDTDSNATTWGAIKDVFEKERPNSLTINADEYIKLRGAKPSSTRYDLKYNASYRSEAFSGKGWRFAGYLFKAINTTGTALRWESYGQSAAIGTKQQAWNTLDSGWAEGQLIKKNEYLYISGTKTYYTNNPVKGTYYKVANVD